MADATENVTMSAEENSAPPTNHMQPDSSATTTSTLDFITAYADYADVFEIPRKAHEWAAIQIIASLLNREVLIPNGGQTLTLDLWSLFLSASGMGRNTILSVAQGVVDQSGIQDLIRNSTWGSAPAFYQQLADVPVGMYVWPEWSIVAKKLNDPRFGSVKEWLTDRYDSLRTPESITYRKTGKSTDTPSILFGTAPRINILASSSQEWFISNLTQPDVIGGFIPRFVPICLPRSNRLIAKPQLPDSTQIVPLAQQLQAMSQLGGNATFTTYAEGLYEHWYHDAHSRFERQLNPALAMPFFNRLRGQVLKLAVIFEVSQSSSLNVSKEAMERAIGTALEIERTVFEILSTGMSREGSEVEKMADLIRHSRSKGLLQSELTLAFKHWSKREREERVATLIESQTIHGFHRQTRGRQAKVYVHREHLQSYKKGHKLDKLC
jgi:hypothetical protein